MYGKYNYYFNTKYLFIHSFCYKKHLFRAIKLWLKINKIIKGKSITLTKSIRNQYIYINFKNQMNLWDFIFLNKLLI